MIQFHIFVMQDKVLTPEKDYQSCHNSESQKQDTELEVEAHINFVIAEKKCNKDNKTLKDNENQKVLHCP